MTALTEYFCEPVYFPRSAWDVVRWWETRRAVYNASVGAAGLATLGVLAVVGMLPPMPFALAMVGAYALAANLCYSLGAVADLAARRMGDASYAAVGPVLFRYGFVFSVGLTLIPIPVVLLAVVAKLLASLV